jgi:hypothetical protein
MVYHTTTGEWQSFEVRMRRRRAECLLLRAEAAIDAGCFDDARQCLGEARELAPSLPGLDDLERKLDAPAPVVQRRATARRVVSAAAVLAIAASGVAGWLMMSGARATVEPVNAAPHTASARPALAPPAPEPLPPPAVVFASETAAAPAPPAPETTRPPAPMPAAATAATPAAAEPAPSVARDIVAQLPVPRIDALSQQAGSEAPLAPPTPAPAIPEPPVETLRLASTAVAAPSAPLAAAPAATPPPPVSQEPAIRSVLNQYAAAFSSLDVDAAQRVWPAVNRGALARAFDSLASQDVSLGQCRIDVIGTQATARCTGSMSWSPKVGDGGEHTAPRSWTFELSRAAAGWAIVSARVQNR